MILPIVIPAKNEADVIHTTITSLIEHLKNTNIKPYIVVVNDGSHDDTANIAQKLNCKVVNLPDRGYSALGLPELANTFNAGFNFIDENLGKNSFEYLMIVGADTIFHNNYITDLIKEMENNKDIAICSGTPINDKTNKYAIRGSGRIIRNSFWNKIGRCYPNEFYSWESYPVIYAQANGYKTKVFNYAKFSDLRDREPLSIVDWKRYGIGMKEKGSIFIYVLGRAFKRLILHKDIKGSIRLLYGYFLGKPQKVYEKKLRDYTRKKELSIILKRKF